MGRRIKLTVAYLGDDFSGWQRQTTGATVQGELERALGVVTGVPATVVGAGRTDAGVHASGQVAHTDLPASIPPENLERALNASLDPRVRILSAGPTSADFHARLHAVAKLYTYRVRWQAPRLPWAGLRTAAVRGPCDADLLERAVALLIGTRDMASFSVPQDRPTVRTLHRVWIDRRRSGVDLHFVGDGFLRYQVRRMVGASLEVGRGRLPLAEFEDLLLKPQPGAPIQTAPARGLTLERVYYRRPTTLQFER